MTRQIRRSHRTKLVVALLALTVGFGTMQTPAHAGLIAIEITNTSWSYTLRGTNGPGLPGFYCQGSGNPTEMKFTVNYGSTAIGTRDKRCTSSRTGKTILGQLYVHAEWLGSGILNIRYHSVLHEEVPGGAKLCGERWYTSNISGRDRRGLTSGFTSSIQVPNVSEPNARGRATSEGANYFAIQFSEGMRPAAWL